MMKKFFTALILAAVAFSANASQSINKQEVKHFKLTKIGTVNVDQSGGEISSPSDLHDKLSELADQKGGKYYVVTSVTEQGANYLATAIVYK